jgi:hypothetical protein
MVINASHVELELDIGFRDNEGMPISKISFHIAEIPLFEIKLVCQHLVEAMNAIALLNCCGGNGEKNGAT